MNTDVLRALWDLITELPPDQFVSVSYDVVITGLLQQLKERFHLRDSEVTAFYNYLLSKEKLVQALVLEYVKSAGERARYQSPSGSLRL